MKTKTRVLPIGDLEMNQCLDALDHLAASVEMPAEALARFEGLINRMTKLQDTADEERESARADYQALEHRCEDMSSALEDVRAYLDSQRMSAVWSLPVTDPAREDLRVTLCTIDDALTIGDES